MSVKPNYFLPASRATLSSFLDAHQVPNSPLGMAALLVAITGAAQSTPSSKLTRMIDEACRLFRRDPEGGVCIFFDSLLRSHELLTAGNANCLFKGLRWLRRTQQIASALCQRMPFP